MTTTTTFPTKDWWTNQSYPNNPFVCIACGENYPTVTATMKYYEASWCLHPVLKALGNKRICTGCYNWDTDAHKRKRCFNTSRGLLLKNGSTIYVHEPSIKPEVRRFRLEHC